MDKESGNSRVFSLAPIQIFSGKYAARICFILMCILCIAVKFDIGTNNIKYPDRIFMILPFMFIFMCITDLLFRKFAYKINFDRDKTIINFFMFFPLIRKKIITVKIEDIKKITLNIFVTFEIDGKRVRYNGVHNDELINFLEDLKPVTWKRLGRMINKYHEWL